MCFGFLVNKYNPRANRTENYVIVPVSAVFLVSTGFVAVIFIK